MYNLEDLNKRYKWTADKKDKWVIMKNETGPLLGDCEDYAITALWLLSEKSKIKMLWKLAKGDAALWKVNHVRQPEIKKGNHVILWVKDKGWLDSSIPVWSPTTPHKKVFKYTALYLPTIILFK